jgi:IS5 family transposase
VDPSIIEAASSTKNKTKARDPEIHQTQKGKEWFFGLKAHIGVDARTELIQCVSTTATNAHDTTETANLIMAKSFFLSKFWLSWRSKTRRVKRC